MPSIDNAWLPTADGSNTPHTHLYPSQTAKADWDMGEDPQLGEEDIMKKQSKEEKGAGLSQ